MNQCGIPRSDYEVVVGSELISIFDHSTDQWPDYCSTEKVSPLSGTTLNYFKGEPFEVFAIAGFDSLKTIIDDAPETFEKQCSHVYIMGGLLEKKTGHFFQPDASNNYTFHWESSTYVLAWIQTHSVNMTCVSRHAVYQAQFDYSLWNQLPNNLAAISLKDRQANIVRHFFNAACLPANDVRRGSLPPDRDRKWFINTFCGGVDLPDGEDIYTHSLTMGKFNLYDPITLVASIHPEWFEPVTEFSINKNNVIQMIGQSAQQHGIRDANAIRDYITQLLKIGLTV